MIFIMAGVPHLRFPGMSEAADSVAVDSVPQDTLPRESVSLDSLPIDTVFQDSLPHDSVMLKDSVLADTVGMDSLHLAIWKRNKAIDDSLYADSLNRQRKNGIDAPVEYSAEDSMTYEASTGLARLYGRSHVKYENMDLESDQVFMSMVVKL